MRRRDRDILQQQVVGGRDDLVQRHQHAVLVGQLDRVGLHRLLVVDVHRLGPAADHRHPLGIGGVDQRTDGLGVVLRRRGGTQARSADLDHRIAQHVPARHDAEARRSRPGAVLALRRAFGDGAGDVGVEVGRGEQNSGGVECARCAIAAVTMSPPQVSSMVMAMPSETQRSRICRALVSPPTLEILRLIDVHGVVGDAAQHGGEAVDHLVQHEGPLRCGRRIDEAFLVGHAGLLDIDVDVAHRVDHARGLVHQPAGIGIGDQDVAGLELRAAARMRSISSSGSPPTLSWNLV